MMLHIYTACNINRYVLTKSVMMHM